MGFLNDRQLAESCRALLRRVELEHLWTADAGPTKDGFAYLESASGAAGELTMLRICVDIWNGHGGASVRDLVHVLDNENLVAICTLLIAMAEGGSAVQRWLMKEWNARAR